MTQEAEHTDIGVTGAGVDDANINNASTCEANNLAEQIKAEVASLRGFCGGYGAAVLVLRKHGYLERT